MPRSRTTTRLPTSRCVRRRPSIRSLLGADGIRFIFSSFVNNFAGFSVVAVVFVAMIGVGVAEEAGLMGALIRKLVAVSPPQTLAFIIVFVGGLSSIATDAGYLILIPLGAAAFLSVGRNPLAGLAAAYAGRQRRLRRQRVDHTARRPAHRGHQRGDPPRRSQPFDRPPPVATPVNLMIMRPAGYRFGDYWKLGLPLLGLYFVVAVFLVPAIWSF